MQLTVKNMLDMFADFKVIAGRRGIYRQITTVSVIDAPDIHEWLKGGEFLITTGYIMRDNTLKFAV
ncbi:Purine catabolism regulatory protein-like family protein [Thermosyntropha lipolytica DSM 11003]|uniref:Purine catabolism regulatory protein-like family protein n=1 Tax=Thermosyntropha lipolytica DSM 11003 TaxID=1123382 RepID=A0A1M5MK18_9FIRM|nr:PucR family transcriptional regulator ligand-binding domain-containing protein [Thermosyntropha lipolytica]SHG77844.1 Purine catabolism regulatory protein-like family protein [Thermosyntropha lipolytica DSM 11003]